MSHWLRSRINLITDKAQKNCPAKWNNFPSIVFSPCRLYVTFANGVQRVDKEQEKASSAFLKVSTTWTWKRHENKIKSSSCATYQWWWQSSLNGILQLVKLFVDFVSFAFSNHLNYQINVMTRFFSSNINHIIFHFQNMSSNLCMEKEEINLMCEFNYSNLRNLEVQLKP